jgi:GNAT superfamily N-acetyltransferase
LIRLAVESDFPEMVEMGRRFFSASGYADIMEYDPESVMVSLKNIPVLLVAEKDKLVGAAGAMVYPFYMSLNHITAQEVFWWVDPEHRGIGVELFDALVSEVKKRGAQSLSMIALENLSPERVGSIYKAKGFRLSEHSYIKKL